MTMAGMAVVMVMVAGTELWMIQTSNLDIILLPTQPDRASSQIHQLLEMGTIRTFAQEI